MQYAKIIMQKKKGAFKTQKITVAKQMQMHPVGAQCFFLVLQNTVEQNRASHDAKEGKKNSSVVEEEYKENTRRQSRENIYINNLTNFIHLPRAE